MAVRPEGSCPFCGKILSPELIRSPCVVSGIDMRLVAKRQRLLLWVILALLALQFSPMFLLRLRVVEPALVDVVWKLSFLVLVLVVVAVVMMLAAMRRHIVVICLYGLLTFAPCANLVILLLVNSQATRALRKAGLRVGLMGVKDEDVVRLLSPNLCRQCAYDLTGNVSGRCPECGTLIPRAVA
jgi:hypothetical protein